MNENTIDRLYNSMINDLDYKDLPETETARKEFKASVISDYLSADDEESYKQWLGMEKLVEEVACANEHQGFIYGFRMAMGLFISAESPYRKSQFEEHIHSEYSTLAVEKIDKAGEVFDILKDYVPEEKYSGAADALCAGLNETKYAAFEQGFIRGIAAVRSGAL